MVVLWPAAGSARRGRSAPRAFPFQCPGAGRPFRAAHMMAMTKHKNQVGQASKNGGEFAAKTHDEAPTVALSEGSDELTAAQIRSACYDAGLEGVMTPVYELILDGADTTDTLMNGYLAELTASDVTAAYNEDIGPAADAVEDYVVLVGRKKTGVSVAEVRAHIKSVCEQAGFPGVMAGVLDVVLDREDFTDQLAGITEEDVEKMYTTIVGPAIDEMQDDIRENHCSECGASLDDGEGYDGLCGNCADRAEAAGRWS